MNIYEITFLLVTYLSLGANSWLRAVLHRFSQEPLEGRGRVFLPGSRWKCQEIFGVICSSSIYHLKTYVSVYL
jgi:hypothetical protein